MAPGERTGEPKLTEPERITDGNHHRYFHRYEAASRAREVWAQIIILRGTGVSVINRNPETIHKILVVSLEWHQPDLAALWIHSQFWVNTTLDAL